MSEKIRQQIRQVFVQDEGSPVTVRERKCPWCDNPYSDPGGEDGAEGWDLVEVPLPPGISSRGKHGSFSSGFWRLTCLKCGWVGAFKEL